MSDIGFKTAWGKRVNAIDSGRRPAMTVTGEPGVNISDFLQIAVLDIN